MEYLEFEQPIKDLEEQLQSCQIVGEGSGVNIKQACVEIEIAIENKKKEIYGNE